MKTKKSSEGRGRKIICCRCGRTWNVSNQYKNKGDYYCPECSIKRHAKKTTAKMVILAAMLILTAGTAPARAAEPQTITKEEFEILCRITEAEATDGTLKNKKNVASCVINRVMSKEFPDTITDVVFQPGQFSPIRDGRYYSVEITKSTEEAVLSILTEGSGHKCTFFCTPDCKSAVNGWFSTLRVCFNDGMHNYYVPMEKYSRRVLLYRADKPSESRTVSKCHSQEEK